MPKKKPTVWVVMHYEFTGVEPCVHIDSVQFHVSSSRRKAEKDIHGCWVSPFSWWQVHPHVLDAQDDEREGEEIYYYSHKGTPLTRPPYKRAQKAWERDKIKNPHLH
ncbi:MAG TPA: hypothetical protein VKA46_05270 [Gemmataceae bacterium]|nr:hypothetical protein [Gemmataceae bacterium]